LKASQLLEHVNEATAELASSISIKTFQSTDQNSKYGSKLKTWIKIENMDQNSKYGSKIKT